MYTVVLMAAMSGAPDLPDFCHRRGRCGGCFCNGCNGCFCGCNGFCGGGCCGGCCGGGCCHRGFCGGYCGGGCYGGCHGCCHNGGVYGGGGAPYYGPGPGQPPSKGGEPVPAPKKKGDAKEVRSAAPAILIVNLPADARLSVDGQATQSTASQRVFMSPPLEPGHNYVYTLRADLTREDGQAITTTQQVTVRAGQETRVNLLSPATTVASGN